MIFSIVHYNTPELTMALVMSILKFNGLNNKVIIFENSDREPFPTATNSFIEIIDNRSGQLVNFCDKINTFIKKNNITQDVIANEHKGSNFGSYKHTLSVEWLLQHIDEPFVLLDSDVLLTKPTECLYDQHYAFVSDIREPLIRIFPFITFLNVPLLKSNNIHFCDDVHIYPNYSTLKNDTGGFFLQSVLASKLPYKKIAYTDYVVHYGNGSWKTKSQNVVQNGGFSKDTATPVEWLDKYKSLYV